MKMEREPSRKKEEKVEEENSVIALHKTDLLPLNPQYPKP